MSILKKYNYKYKGFKINLVKCNIPISRSSMLVNAMNNEEFENLRICVEDKMHQEYRKNLINGIDDIFIKAKEFGSLGEFISGAGSTLIALIHKTNYKFCDNMTETFADITGTWESHLLKPNLSGARVYIPFSFLVF